MVKIKIVCLIMLMCVCVMTATIVVANVFAADLISEEDFKVVTGMISAVACEENISLEGIDYVVNNVYFSNEQLAGYIVDFSTSYIYGYAIIFKVDGNYTLVEISFDRSSPYADRSGMFIYPSLGYYVVKIDGKYYDAETMEPLIDYTVTREPLFYAACGSKSPDLVDKTINYSHSTLVKYEITDFFVDYSSDDSVQGYNNNCANVAGVVALNYWNKYFGNNLLNLPGEDLIDGNMNWTWSHNAAGRYMDIFYDYMNTNWLFGVGGTIPRNCYKGFEKLITEKGYKIERIKCDNFVDAKENIDNNIPVFVTSSDYYFTTSYTTDRMPEACSGQGDYSTTFHYERYHGISNAHTFIGYGYALYNFKVGSAIEFGLFLKVADGAGRACYFNYDLGKVTDAAAIRVYQ